MNQTETIKDRIFRRPIVGIMGGSLCEPNLYEEVRSMAGDLARAGCIILCGGGTGVMEAAARGASEAGGITVGILPGSDDSQSPANAWIQIPIYTGLSDARNAINVRSADVILAVGGSYGTLSEIALAAKIGKPVILYKSWILEAPPVGSPGDIRVAGTLDAAAEMIRRLIAGRWPGVGDRGKSP